MVRRLPLLLALAAAFSVFPRPVVALSAPVTLAETASFGEVRGVSRVVETGFSIDHLGVSWASGSEPSVRFLREGEWSTWEDAHPDGLPGPDGRTYSGLVLGNGAEAYQVRADAGDVRAIAINTTDGPRRLQWRHPQAAATHLVQPAIVSRSAWGADESLRFKPDGTPKGQPSFYPTQKLIVHHTATSNADPDPAGTVRAIYYDHVVNRGYQDIAYNFLVDAQGQIYKGRYSGPSGTWYEDTSTGEDASGYGVTGAHTLNYNSGTMGISLLGNFTSVPPTPQARTALIEQLAWEADHHGLDPMGTSTYVNPSGSTSKTAPNITGHRDWGSTECPGGVLYADLPAIRQEVAARVGRIDGRPPRLKRIDEAAGKKAVVVTWETNEPATTELRYRLKGKGWRDAPDKPLPRERHRIRLAGLKPGSKYSYRVGSTDRAGNDAWSRPLTFETPS